MIGMSQIKKKVMQGLFIGIAIGVVGIGLTIWWTISTIKSYENGTNKSYNEKYTQDVVVCKRDVIQGEVLTEDMVTIAKNINKNTIPNGAKKSASEVVGSVAKYNIAANVPVLDSMLTTEIEAADVRSQELNTVLMPTDLNIGDFVDIRVMFPNGTDYVVLAQKKIENIVGTTFWINMAEDERLLLNSATVDSFLNQGSKLYATKYTDATSQTNLSEEATTTAKGYVSEEIDKDLDTLQSADAEEFTEKMFDLIVKYKNFASAATRITENYQPNAQVMNLMKTNDNILDQAKEKLSEEARRVIENGITNYKSSNEENYSNIVSGAQQSITTQQNQRTALLNETAAQTTQPAE